MKAMRARFGKAVKSGRKSIKVPKGEIPADADLVVTLSHRERIGFYLPDEGRWVVSFPEQHHQRGLKKEKATDKQFKRTIRMFKAARNQLVSKRVLTKEDAPSYFIECLLYNVPDESLRTGAGADVPRHPDLAEDREAEGPPVPEWPTAPVRTSA